MWRNQFHLFLSSGRSFGSPDKIRDKRARVMLDCLDSPVMGLEDRKCTNNRKDKRRMDSCCFMLCLIWRIRKAKIGKGWPVMRKTKGKRCFRSLLCLLSLNRNDVYLFTASIFCTLGAITLSSLHSRFLTWRHKTYRGITWKTKDKRRW